MQAEQANQPKEKKGQLSEQGLGIRVVCFLHLASVHLAHCVHQRGSGWKSGGGYDRLVGAQSWGI